MNLNDKIIKIHCNKLEWSQIINKFDNILQQKINLNIGDNFYHKAQILKEKFGFNENTDFINAYKKISDEDKLIHSLPDINSDDYSRLLNNKSWYEFLDLKPDFYTIDELKKKLFGMQITEKTFIKLNKKDPKIPKYPEYYYKNFSYNLFNNITKNIEI